MGEQMNEEKQVAVSMCSSPSVTNSQSPRRSNQVLELVVPNGIGTLQPAEPSLEVPLIKKVAAEFLGTFILIFTMLSTIIMNDQHDGVESLLGIATSAGLAAIAVVLSTVHISGSHLNPAVSIAMGLFGYLPLPHVIPYMTAQTVASICASFLVKGIYHPARPAVIATIPSIGVAVAFFLEFVLTFVLVFVITAVATDPNAGRELIAIAIAAVIMMNSLIGGPSTGPSMNPARTIGAALATGKYTNIWIYILATPLGAIAGTATYKFIKP